MEMVYIALWLGLSVAVGAAGSTKKIGFFWAFLVSAIASPLIGILLVVFDKKKEEPAK